MISLAMALVTLAMLSAIGVLWIFTSIVKEIIDKKEESTK